MRRKNTITFSSYSTWLVRDNSYFPHRVSCGLRTAVACTWA